VIYSTSQEIGWEEHPRNLYI